MRSYGYFTFTPLLCAFFMALCPHSSCGATSYYKVYAPPVAWGNWTCVGYNAGVINYGISFEAMGDTKVIAEVKYLSDNGLVYKRFLESIEFTTGDFYGGVWVRFKGIPFGSMVEVFVVP